MPTTLALVKKELQKKPEESDEDYQDRMVQEAYWKLRERKKRTKREDEEYKDLQNKYVAYLVANGGLAPTITDVDLRSAAGRLYRELSAEHACMTPLKRLLLDRLIAAWSMAVSYERLFQLVKYKTNMEGDDPQLSYTNSRSSLKLMQETRKGIETANDQIIRLSQALRNLSAPPLQVQVKNAYIAQNQQINQSAPKNDAETPA